MFRNETFYPRDMVDKKYIMDNFERQLNEEKNLMIQVPSIRQLSQSEQKLIDKYENLQKILIRNFREEITKNFLKNINLLEQSENQNSEILYPFLTIMKPQVYIDILIQASFN